MNIPIYRAKRLMDGAEYVEGYLLPSLISNAMHRILVDNGSIYFVDDLTLAIHLPDMIDSEGNKIFASLSEDGKGGDIMKDDEYYGIAKYKDSRFVVEYENVEECLCEGNFEIVGIQ